MKTQPVETLGGRAAEPLLEVRGLTTIFHTQRGPLRAVDGLSLSVCPGRCLAIVGESGSGKSVTALSIMRLIDYPGEILEGEVLFKGRDLLRLSEREMQQVRGAAISMVFQDPLTTLNPLFSVETHLVDVLRQHRRCSRSEARERAVEMLRLVGVPDPESRLRSYPFELSGGLRQRVSIAMALSCDPSLVIMDEPTTALDVSIQAQILDLVSDLKSRLQFAVMFITHDLEVAAHLADDVLIMYAGRCLEYAPADAIFSQPANPYTSALLTSAPSLAVSRGQRLKAIEGALPDLTELPPGCVFSPRCWHRGDRCTSATPALGPLQPDHLCACHYPIVERDGGVDEQGKG